MNRFFAREAIEAEMNKVSSRNVFVIYKIS